MVVSEERIQELLDQMLDNADENGWCYIPENISDEESDALSRRIAIISMQDRIDDLMDGILETIKFMNDIKEKVDDYDTIEIIKIDSALAILKEDSQNILIDLHSPNKIGDFFKIELVVGDGENSLQEAEDGKQLMLELIDTEFREPLDKVKEYCLTIIQMTDDLREILKLRK